MLIASELVTATRVAQEISGRLQKTQEPFSLGGIIKTRSSPSYFRPHSWFSKSGILFRTIRLTLSWLIVACAEIAFGTSVESPPMSAEQSDEPASSLGISANPGAVNQTTGTGQAGEWLGFKKDSGVYLGGVWAAD